MIINVFTYVSGQWGIGAPDGRGYGYGYGYGDGGGDGDRRGGRKVKR
jgi:hypothetical protein